MSSKNNFKYLNFDWGFPIFLSLIFLSSFVYSLIIRDDSNTQFSNTQPLSTKVLEIDSKPITSMEAQEMVKEDAYFIHDFSEFFRNGELVSFVFLVDDGINSKILSISAKAPKNRARIKTVKTGNIIELKYMFDGSYK